MRREGNLISLTTLNRVIHVNQDKVISGLKNTEYEWSTKLKLGVRKSNHTVCTTKSNKSNFQGASYEKIANEMILQTILRYFPVDSIKNSKGFATKMKKRKRGFCSLSSLNLCYNYKVLVVLGGNSFILRCILALIYVLGLYPNFQWKWLNIFT